MPAAEVRRRLVLYVGGFDPRGPAHYHRLYRDNARQQAAVNGVAIEVGTREAVSDHVARWAVRRIDAETGSVVETRYEFLRWDDLVRAHWPANLAVQVVQTLRTAWDYLRTGAMGHMRRLDWRPWSALMFPPLMLVVLGLLLPALLLLLLGLGQSAGWTTPWQLANAALLALYTGAWLFAWAVDRRMQFQWLMRTWVFTHRMAVRKVAGLDERLDEFAGQLLRCCRDAELDEVLIVGHSLGTMLAPAMLARALRRDPRLAGRGPRVALLTLGECSPMLSSFPGSEWFADDLELVAQAQGLDWLDFTAPSDYCSFALVDPVAAAGRGGSGSGRPKLLSARFVTMFPPARYAEIRKDAFRLHFQYLMASEQRSDYDYFEITAGPLTLGGRYAAQAGIRNFRRGKRPR